MKERPIIFSAPEVRAILAGRKTVTRRVVKPQPYPNGFRFDGRDILCHIDDLPANAMLLDVGRGKARYTTSNLEGWEIHCPCGQPGERLWVREVWAVPHRYDHLGPSNIPVKGVPTHYAATEERGGLRWRSPVNMCRWASRITLEIESVRVERLQDISEADAMAEGCAPNDECEQGFIDPCTGRLADAWKYKAGTAAESFCNRWERTHEKRLGDHGEHGWTANPWVWVLSFKRVTP